jgi:very-short-patch-repair endonuclease
MAEEGRPSATPEIPASPAVARAASSPPETPAGRIARWKERLLDLTLRNRLLHFREGKKTIPLLLPSAEELEDALASGSGFTLASRGAFMDGAGGADPRDATLHQARTGEDPRVAYLKAELAARRIRTPLDDAELKKRLVELDRAARSVEEESGVSTLHLALGFLLWYESDDSTLPRRAPLLLLPLRLERRGAREGFVISLSDEEPRVNHTLLQKVQSEFGVDISALHEVVTDEDGIDVASTLQAWRLAVESLPRWEVEEAAAIGLFSFARFLLWNDLQTRGADLLQCAAVRHLVETPGVDFEPDAEFPEAASLDESHPPSETFCLRDADSSQLAAVFASAAGRSFVLEGPPGTGKSQTITNLVSHALATGKRVLFVAEKRAALDVVHERLKDVGLAPFCLELHSHKASRREVVQRLVEAQEAQAALPSEAWANRATELGSLRRGLNDLVRAMHLPRRCGESVFRATAELLPLRDAPKITLACATMAAIDGKGLDAMREAVEALGAMAREARPANHPLDPCGREDWEPGLEESAKAAADALRTAAEDAHAAWSGAGATLALPTDPSEAQWAAVVDAAAFLAASPRAPAALPGLSDLEDALTRLRTAVASAARRDTLRAELASTWNDAFLREEAAPWTDALRAAVAAPAILSWLRTWLVRRRLATFARAGTAPDAQRCLNDLERLREFRERDDVLRDPAHEGARLLGRFWKDGAPAADEVGEVLRWATTFRAALLATAPAEPGRTALLQRWCTLAAEPEPAVVLEAHRVATAARALAGARAAATALFVVDSETAFGPWFAPAHAKSVAERARRWAEGAPRLRAWCAWRRARRSAVALQLDPLVAAVERGTIPAESLDAAFERSFREAWLRVVLREETLLREFSSADTERRIERFRRVDAEVLKLARDEVRARLARALPARYQGTSLATSEAGILAREARKKGRHMAVRRLLASIPTLLPRLKPCLLMSPLSVAQYLDPALPPVDIVVFDEASQVPTWDAVGAMARGKQVIVVGDTKQLPPTSFFEKAQREDEEESVDAADPGDLESLLDECSAAGFRRLYLGWHYRSRHESLITFSNRRYYDNRLLTFPSAADRVAGLGVSLRPVAGVYDRGGARSNRIEAEAVVGEVVRRLRDPVECRRSLGVVTFNLPQQTLILDLLDAARSADPSLEPYFSEDAHEPVFVKNLENVQGDERDCILFSIGFARDAQGKMTMNFGPLNAAGGERRLNVAVTRAREEVVVFTGLRPEDIDPDRVSAAGVRDLRAFLDYAGRGVVALDGEISVTGHGFDSPLEKEIHDALVAKGHLVEPQVGCSGYRIDLGVRDPSQPGAYLLGVECDGASYHSARTARDRDRLRASVLESLGWRLHRVWSTDWWQDRERTLGVLEAAIEKARVDGPRARERTRSAVVPEVSEGESPFVAGDGASVGPGRVTSLPSPPGGFAPPPPQPSDAPSLPNQKPYEPAPPLPDRRARDLHASSSDALLLEDIAQLVRHEGPMTLFGLMSDLLPTWGVGRATERVRNRITRLVARGGPGFRVEDEVFWPDAIDRDVWREFRVPTDDPASRRTIEEIPLEEAANAAEALLAIHVAIPRGDLVRETARLLGFGRTGARVEDHLERALDLLAARERVRISPEGMVSAAPR